jgi:hypothetical protein
VEMVAIGFGFGGFFRGADSTINCACFFIAVTNWVSLFRRFCHWMIHTPLDHWHRLQPLVVWYQTAPLECWYHFKLEVSSNYLWVWRP